MAHKGRPYRVRDYARPWGAFFSWPHLFANDYWCYVSLWQSGGVIAPPNLYQYANGTYVDLDPGNSEWSFRAPFLGGGPGTIEAGFVYELDTAGAHDRVYPMAWWDGIEQLDRSVFYSDPISGQFFGWYAFSPVVGYAIYPINQMEILARGY